MARNQTLILAVLAALAASCSPIPTRQQPAGPTATALRKLTTATPARPTAAPEPIATNTPAASLATPAGEPTPKPTAHPQPTRSPTATPVPARSLRGHARAWGIHVGAAVAAGPLQGDPAYAETLAREFSMVTPENALKFGPIHPGRDQYDFDAADAIVAFAEEHEMQVRGHTLVWHNQLPTWLEKDSWSREELMTILHDHIKTVVGRYRGRIVAWDVVNEAVADDGSLRDTIWLRTIGPEYVDLAFQWAHEADPDALLFYNDYGGEGLCPKSDAIYALAQDLLDRGAPIHGVGLQMHVSLTDCRTPESVADNIDRLMALGLLVHITEMDVRITEPVTEKKLEAQARIYRDMLGVCLNARWCTAFVLWGFTDCYSWIPDFFPGCGAGLIFDENYEPKPACDALEEALGGR